MHNYPPNYAIPQITNFSFMPHSFRIGADKDLTVITGYLKMSKDIIDTVKRRRCHIQMGDPAALIATYDMETHQLDLYCIDTLDTQCRIHLRNREVAALHRSFTCSIKREYHDTPEHLLNTRRMKAHLPTLL